MLSISRSSPAGHPATQFLRRFNSSPTSRFRSLIFRCICPDDTTYKDSFIMCSLLGRLTSPPAQTLRVLQPTPSTITYTVSTRSVPTTLPAHAAYYVGILFRILLGVASVLLLWIKWRTSNEVPMSCLRDALGSEGGQLGGIIEALQWRYLIPSTLVITFLVLKRNYTGTLSMPFPFVVGSRRGTDWKVWRV